ncbi:hypothetical protein Tco_1273956, partial [Tanacetum coccineum]
NSLEVLKLLENSVEVLKILESKLESMKILENKLEPLKLQENQPLVRMMTSSYDENYVDLVDAQSVVHVVKMNRDLEPSVWSFNGDKWIEFMSSFEVLDPNIIHFDQINHNRFVVNFYTKDGDEVDYGRTKDHCDMCLVLGCHDPRMYQFVGVAFTGLEWERVCESEMFSASKVIVISSDEYGGSFVGKVIHGFVSDTNVVAKNISGPGESSNSAAVSEKSFVIEFNSCAERKGYLVWFFCFSIYTGVS